MINAESVVARRVFLCYERLDHALAQRISDALAESDMHVTRRPFDVSSGEGFSEWLRDVGTNDIVVMLLSPTAAAGAWGGPSPAEAMLLLHYFDQRGAELIPVLGASTDLPAPLGDRAVVDLTNDVNAGLRQLVEQIQVTTKVNFSTMNPQEFEGLVADLLLAVGFRFDQPRDRPHPGVDLHVTYQQTDPFGSRQTEVWLVETKLYSHQRVSVEAINQLAALLSTEPPETRGLVVTNAQLTSVAQEYLAQLERRSHVRVRVLDGVELKRLLRQFPEVAARHFDGETRPDDEC